MATQLFLLSTNPSTHLGADHLKLNGGVPTAGENWTPLALGLARGSGLIATPNTGTVGGPTAGTELWYPSSGKFPEWISEPVAADVTISGTITANIWAAETDMSANVAVNVVIEIIRANATATRNSNTLVEIVRSTRVTEAAVTTRAVNNFTTGMASGGYTPQTLNRGDRLRVRVFADDAGTMASGYFWNVGFNGATAAADGDSYVTLTENITFEAAPGTASVAIDQSVWGAGLSSAFGGSVTNEKQAQQFTAAGSITAVDVSLRKTASPTDNVVCELWSDASDLPSSLLATSSTTVTGTSVGTTEGTYVNFALSYATAASTKYWIVLRRSGSLDAVNFYNWDRATGNPYADGIKAALVGGTWTPNTADDLRFRVYGAASPTTTIYLTDTASAVSTASVDREAWTSRGSGVATDVTNTAAGFTAPIQVTDTAGGTVVDWFTKQLQAVTLTGMAQANLRALESNASANASLRLEIARVASDGTSPTVWASWCMSANNTRTGELTTSEAAEAVNVSGDDLAISDGQRLRIRLYLDDMPTTAMGASQTVTTYYGGTSGGASGDTYITFPLTLTEYSPGGGTTYTDAGFGTAGLFGAGASDKVSGAAPGPAFRRQRRASRHLTFR